MNTKPITGPTKACLEHFSRAVRFNSIGQQPPRNVYVARNKVCELLGVYHETGHEWFSKGVLPVGLNLIKLRCLLELVGYALDERNAYTIQVRELADQVAFSAVSLKDVTGCVGVNEGSVMSWFNGGVTPTKEKLGVIAELVEKHREEAEKRRTQWMKDLTDLHLVPASHRHEPAVVEPSASQSLQASGLTHSQTIETLAHLVLAAKPLADHLLSEDYSPEERELLRQRTRNGRSHGVFDLANALNRLCGERARKEIGNQQNQQ